MAKTGLPNVLILERPDPRGGDTLFLYPWKVYLYPPDLKLPKPSVFLERFATTCETLAQISVRELQQRPLLGEESKFLENTIERIDTYYGSRQYSGWYPHLYYWGQYVTGGRVPTAPTMALTTSAPPDHDSAIPDFLVADVHTDGPSEVDGDPGAILHEGIGRVNLLMIAVDNGPDRMVFAGPVFSHHEFAQPYGTHLTDDQWKSDVEAGKTPDPPPWTQFYLSAERPESKFLL